MGLGWGQTRDPWMKKVNYKKNENERKTLYNYIDLCLGRHGVLLNSKRHIDRRGVEVNMVKFTVQ